MSSVKTAVRDAPGQLWPWLAVAMLAGASVPFLTRAPIYVSAGAVILGLGVAVLTAATLARRLERAVLAVFLLAATVAADLPFTSEYVTGGARPGPVLWLSDIGLAAAILVLSLRVSLRGDRGFLRAPGPLGKRLLVLLILLIGWEVLSALGARLPRHAAFQVIQDASAVPVALLVFLWVRSAEDAKFVIHTLLLALTFHIALAYAQLAHGGPFGLSALGEVRRESLDYLMFTKYIAADFQIAGFTVGNYFSGLVGAPYKLAGLAVLVAPMCLATAVAAKPTRRPLWYALLLAAVVLVLLSLARGAWGALAVALATAWWLLRYTALPHGRRLVKTGRRVVVVAVLAGGALFFQALKARLLETNLERTFDQRLQLLEAGLAMLSDPIRGLGPNNFATLFTGIPDVGLLAGTPIHNIYAVYFVETGIVGLTLFLAVAGTIALLGFRLVRQGLGEISLFSGAIVAGLIGFLAWGVTEWIYRDHVLYTTFWILTGLLVALEQLAMRKGTQACHRTAVQRDLSQERID